MLPPRPGLVSKEGGHDIQECAVTAESRPAIKNKHFIFQLVVAENLVEMILSV